MNITEIEKTETEEKQNTCTEAYSEPSQTSKKEHFEKIANGLKSCLKRSIYTFGWILKALLMHM